MATMTTAQFQRQVAPVLITVMDGVGKQVPEEWSQVFETKTGIARKYDEVDIDYGFGLASVKNEGQRINFDAGGIAYTVQMPYVRYALGFALTEDLMDDGDALKVASRFSRYLARALIETDEVVHVDVLNWAINAAYAGGDGVSLLNTAHPLAAGGTFSNKLSTPADPSHAALRTLTVMMKRAPNERGLPELVRGKQIICAPEQQHQIIEIMKSEKRSGTANNDVNSFMYTSDIAKPYPVVLRRMSYPNMWGIQTDVEGGLTHLAHPKGGLKRAMEGDFLSGDARWKASKRYWTGFINPRCFWGSEGTA